MLVQEMNNAGLSPDREKIEQALAVSPICAPWCLDSDDPLFCTLQTMKRFRKTAQFELLPGRVKECIHRCTLGALDDRVGLKP